MYFKRIVLLYILFVFVALVISAVLFGSVTVYFQTFFVVVAPAVAVVVYELRRLLMPKSDAPAQLADFVPSRRGAHLVTSPSSHGPATEVMPSQHPGWVPKGHRISVLGYTINGMVYVGNPPTLSQRYGKERSRPYIDPGLAVDATGDNKKGVGMNYWPNYSTISAQCRATYLTWLATGAKDGSYSAGYMFLYFYGLERRFFVDAPTPEERLELLDEVRRLADVFASSGSAQQYLDAFIDYALILTNPVSDLQPVFSDAGKGTVPNSVRLAIGTRVQNGEALDADWVLSWFLGDLQRPLRTAARRCWDEFIALFRIRFDAQHPNGLKVTMPKATLTLRYQAASGEFNYTASPSTKDELVPDISRLRKPINTAQHIADEVTEELGPLSRYLGRNPDGRGDIAAHTLLPPDLRHVFPSAKLEKVRAWATDLVTAGGMVPVIDVLERLNGEAPQELSKRLLTDAADTLAQIGFGMAPDPRFALRSPAIDEPVVLFDLGGTVEKLADASDSYRSAVMELALASFIAHADGVISGPQRATLEARVQSVTGLGDHERPRLGANLEWFVAVPPDLALLRRKLKGAGPDQQLAFRAALVHAARADGIVKPEEVARIENIYRALELDAKLVYSDLHADEVADDPRWVVAPQPGAAGEPIPPEPKTGGRTLDSGRIASIRDDTRAAATILGGIFGSEEAAATASGSTAGSGGESASSSLPGLDEKHTALIREVITRPRWSEDEFAELVGAHGLMVAGALETVNEWSFAVHDDALLDEYDGYDVCPEIAAALSDTFGYTSDNTSGYTSDNRSDNRFEREN